MKTLLREQALLNDQALQLMEKARQRGSEWNEEHDAALQFVEHAHKLEALIQQQRAHLALMVSWMLPRIVTAIRSNDPKESQTLVLFCAYVTKNLYSEDGVDISKLQELAESLPPSTQTQVDDDLQKLDAIQTEAAKGFIKRVT